jgi:hypothetical protein
MVYETFLVGPRHRAVDVSRRCVVPSLINLWERHAAELGASAFVCT